MRVRLYVFGLVAVVTLLSAAPLRAQQPALASPIAGQQAAPAAEALLIGPGDLLHLQVFKVPELEQHVRVTDNGDIPVLLLGDTVVEGLTPGQATLLIENRLQSGGFILHPHVSITVDNFATQSIYVFGQVHTPAALVSPVPRTVPEVISQAGGLTEAASFLVTIRRRNTGQLLKFKLSNDAAEVFDQNILVYPGDSVFVNRAPLIYVLGNVARAGGYALSDNQGTLTALEALALAGGAQPTSAPNQSTLLRKDKTQTHVAVRLSLDRMRKGEIPDLPLQADDILYVPFSNVRNVIVSLPNILSAASSAAIYAVH